MGKTEEPTMIGGLPRRRIGRVVLCWVTGLQFALWITLCSILTAVDRLGAQSSPRYIIQTAHNQGNLQVALDNIGEFGVASILKDPFTGEVIGGFDFPRSSGFNWGGGLFMVGSIMDKGKDTAVTWGEFLPDEPPLHLFKYETLDANHPLHSNSANSNLDIICEYNDSISNYQLLGKLNHHPLYVRVRQRSMAWSADNIDDFILVECEIENIGASVLRGLFVGCDAYASISHTSDKESSYQTLIGSRASDNEVVTCSIPDSIFVGYWMENDGNPVNQRWTPLSPTGAIGICLLEVPGATPHLSFNWYTYNDILRQYWGPYKRIDEQRFPRNDLNYPQYDASAYYLLTNGYIAYDQSQMALDHSSTGWNYPPPNAEVMAGGTASSDFILGSGPSDLGPGQRVHFTYAIVGGENVHVNPTDFADYWDPYHPEDYYSKLDFTELMTNARWAKWVYDNPGVDTDGDGFFGKFRLCDGDTNWYEGDGVPDFRADIPPPSPRLKVIPSLNSLTLRWNGYYSENAIDPFTKVKDFEGYRVYLGLDDRESSYSTLISWDYPNYNRYYLREKPNHTFAWETKDLPFAIDSLRSIYGDYFYPLQYTKDNPLHVGDTQYAFLPVDYNLSSLISNGVHKVYPEAINPGADSTLWTDDQLTDEHGRPLPKYYEYEYTVDNLLPTIPYYLSVSSFDFGFAKGNIPAKESSKRENQTIAYAQTSAELVQAENLNVYVYPNPYIWQKDYHSLGYENRDNTQIPDRSHRINFGNLPPRCKISIFSLDGDLIRSWDHNFDSGDPQAMHDAWDLITRNTMLPVAGLYYWVVESEGRTQIGKFVIVM